MNHNYEELMTKFRLKSNDTGSTAIQIIQITQRIAELTEHLKVHKKDVAPKRTLLRIVARRKRDLKYLKKVDFERYLELIKALNLKIKL